MHRTRAYVDVEHLVLAHVSGVGQYTAELLAAMDRRQAEYPGVEVTVGTYARWLDRLDRFSFGGLRRRRMPFPLRISNQLKERHLLPPIDLMMGRGVYLFPNYSAWPTVRAPTIPFVYDLSYIHHAQFVHPKNRDFLTDQVPRALRRAGRVLTISQNSRSEIIEHYAVDPASVFVAYPAVDTERFRRRNDAEVALAKARYGIDGQYLMFVGNVEPRKGLVELLRAYGQLPAGVRREFALLLVGAKGWLDDEITERIIQLRIDGNRIIRPSEHVADSDLPALYSGAELFVYPSHYEGFGIPPLEAMACGVPVVTAHNSALPEAVGDAAVAIDSHDPEAIADAIQRVLADTELAKSLIDRGHDQVERFSYDDSARIVYEQIEQLA